MKDYSDLIAQIPQQAWQYVTAEVQDGEDGEMTIQFGWDDEAHPELAPLNLLTEDQWNDFVANALETAINEADDNETEGDSEQSHRHDGTGGELD
jgi:hypothetical protein